ncbi:MAG: VWA domain-containing protein [Planctomyces sp.]|nr:VWA domain-containing protein [Planctomyces sp.]
MMLSIVQGIRSRLLQLIRTLWIVLLILAMSGFSIRGTSSQSSVIVLLDRSVSIGMAGRREINSILERLPNSRQVMTRDFSGIDDSNPTMSTDIAAAIDSAAAAFSDAESPHIVLVTDGRETHGDAVSSAVRHGIPVSSILLRNGRNPDVEVSEIRLPPSISSGEPVSVAVVLTSTDRVTIGLDLEAGSTSVGSQQLLLDPGETVVTVTHRFTEPTTLQASIRLISEDPSRSATVDTFSANNRRTLTVTPAEPLKVLLIDSAPEVLVHFRQILSAEGIAADAISPANAPITLSELNQYGVVLLSSIPATDLNIEQQEAICDWVATHGGGLMMVGGDQSFGPGGYYQTRIEELLPVRCDFIEEQEKPQLGMILIIDKSGSMSGPKMELAKDAAKAAVELLSPTDSLGVIAFDGAPAWVQPFSLLDNRDSVLERISAIAPGGGTSLFPAMVEANTAMQASESRIKHVLILTDGYSSEGDFESIATQLINSGVTVSAAGLGDADRSLVEKLAAIGRGRHYFTNDPQSVPQIFARETMLAANTSFRESAFRPIPVRSSISLFGIPFTECPPLHGYVRTRQKPAGELLLAAENGDPVLSWMRTGAGFSAAFTSDIKPRWSRDWLQWNACGKFWAQVLRKIQRRLPVNYQEKQSSMETPLSSAMATTSGSVQQNEDIPRELSIGDANEQLLIDLAQNTGGRFGILPEDVLQIRSRRFPMSRQPLAPYLITAALLLLLPECFLRLR